MSLFRGAPPNDFFEKNATHGNSSFSESIYPTHQHHQGDHFAQRHRRGQRRDGNRRRAYGAGGQDNGQQRHPAGLLGHRGHPDQCRGRLPGAPAAAEGERRPGRPLFRRVRPSDRWRAGGRRRDARHRFAVGQPRQARAAFAVHSHRHSGHRPEQYAGDGPEDSVLCRPRPALQSGDGQRGAEGSGRQDHPGRHGALERRLSLFQERV